MTSLKWPLWMGLVTVFVAAGCGGSRSTASAGTTTPASQQSSIPTVGQGDGFASWRTFESNSWGLRLSVPDPDRCNQSRREGMGLLLCQYDDFTIEVWSFDGRMTIAEMRRLAENYTELERSYWQYRAGESNQNGYTRREWYSAAGNGAEMWQFCGISSRRNVSHLVFVYGQQAAMRRRSRDLGRFIGEIHAI